MLTINVIAIVIRSDTTELQSCCSGSVSWVWLIIILVIISCTDLFLYFLHLFSNFIQFVPLLFTPVQLCTVLNFWKMFMSSHFIDVAATNYTVYTE